MPRCSAGRPRRLPLSTRGKLGQTAGTICYEKGEKSLESLSACLDRGPGPHARRRRRADKLWGAALVMRAARRCDRGIRVTRSRLSINRRKDLKERRICVAIFLYVLLLRSEQTSGHSVGIPRSRLISAPDGLFPLPNAVAPLRIVARPAGGRGAVPDSEPADVQQSCASEVLRCRTRVLSSDVREPHSLDN